MDAMKALLDRKSVRGYEKKEVEREKIAAIVEAGQHAPNAGPIQLTVITNGELLEKIDAAALEAMKKSGNAFIMERAAMEGYHPLYGAPALILASAPPDGFCQVNAACAATVMTVAATALELASCYVISPTLALDGKNELSKRLALPANYKPMCGVILGYAGEDKFVAPRAKADNVNYLP